MTDDGEQFLLPVALTIVPRSKVARHLLSKSRGHLFRTLISIGDPGARVPAGYSRVRPSLRLEFQDIIDADDPLGPKEKDVEAIIKFAPTVGRLGGSCLIHCEAGISRSTAAGLITLRCLLGPGSESKALGHVVAQVPDAAPNRLMLKMADELLENSGQLVAALTDHVLRSQHQLASDE